MSKLGTTWVAPGQGSTYHEINCAFGVPPKRWPLLSVRIERTNLLLTGELISEYDWARLESAQFKVGE